jgi:phosphoglycolate phosphatase
MLRIAGKTLAPRLVILDKDGTLIAFDAMWKTWFARLMDDIAAVVPLSAEAHLSLAGTLGYDSQTAAWDPLGPLTLASTGELGLLIASQIYRYGGKTWSDALVLVQQAEKTARAALADTLLIQPIGDVRGWLTRLRASGLLLALCTTDDRQATQRALDHLDLGGLFATTVCGDDGIPLKPAPDMAREILRRLGVAAAEAIMIGDTVADMVMARQAGLACAIGVSSGALPHHLLAPHADLMIPDIHSIEIIPDMER